MVKQVLNKRKDNHDIKDALEVLLKLRDQGCKWAVLQSLHLICGHEFDRLVSERDSVNIRLSMGLPLLTSSEDYFKASWALKPLIPKDPNLAVILVGHGTDHPAWTAYAALEDIMRKTYGENIFTGVVEGYPDREITLERVKTAGFRKVCIIPFMLVAGVHFKEDLTGHEDSWQKTFEQAGIKVSIVDHGIGEIDMISDIFCDHIRDALDIITK
jgi:sirohydrochlorin cobaltochelatase